MALDINRIIASIRAQQGDNWLAMGLRQLQDAHNQLEQTVAALSAASTATPATTATTPATTVTEASPSGVKSIFGGNAISILGTPTQPTVAANAATATTEGVIKLAQDLGGTADLPHVVGLQTIPVSTTAPTDAQLLIYSGTDAQWEPKDLPAGASGTYYLDQAASPIATYDSLITTYPTSAEATAIASGNNVSGQVLAMAFAGPAVNVTAIAAGMWTPSIYASVDSLTQTPLMIIKVYTRNTAGTETLQGTMNVTLTATTTTLYTPTIELPTIPTEPTDIVVLKIYLQAGGSSTRTLTIYFDGTTHVSHMHAPIQAVNYLRTEPVNHQTGTTYTFKDTDRGYLVTFNNAAAVAVTLPQAGASNQFLEGWFVDTDNYGAGTVTITPTTSTIDGAASVTLSTNQGIRIVSGGANYYTVRGKSSGAASGVSSLDSITGAITLVAGSNITITDNSPTAGKITLAASGGGSYPTPITQNVTGVSSVVFTSDITTSYRDYEIRISDVTLATGSGVTFGLQFSTDNGATYDTAANYYMGRHYMGVLSGAGEGGGVNLNATLIQPGLYGPDTFGAGDVFNMRILLFHPLSSTYLKYMAIQTLEKKGTAYNYLVGGAIYNSTTPVNAFRFISTGTFTGTFVLQPLPQ